MDDRQRLDALAARLATLSGLDEQRFGRLLRELNAPQSAGADVGAAPLKVAVFDAKKYDIDSLDRANAGRFTLDYLTASLSTRTVAAIGQAKAICIFVNDQCDAQVVEALASVGVELIALRCAGFNNVDLAACRRCGIDVVRVPEYSPYAVAEHTVALMLMLNRHLHLAYQRNRVGYFLLDGLIGFDMKGKQVGVVGTGRIGRATISILRGFGCRILAYDKNRSPEIAEDAEVRYVELDELLSSSDIITLHVPLFPETRYLIDERAIEQMKPGVMLINTSRGGLVDTKALIAGLKSGRIGFAGLDVYEEEAGIFFHDLSDQVLSDDVLARLMTFNNVVITSHQAFLTREALDNIADTTLANLAEFAADKRGASLSNVVLPS